MKTNVKNTLLKINLLFHDEEVKIKPAKSKLSLQRVFKRISLARNSIISKIIEYLYQQIIVQRKIELSIEDFEIIILDEKDFWEQSNIFYDINFTAISEKIFYMIHTFIKRNNKKTKNSWSELVSMNK